MLHRKEQNFRLVAHNKTSTSKQKRKAKGSRNPGKLYRKSAFGDNAMRRTEKRGTFLDTKVRKTLSKIVSVYIFSLRVTFDCERNVHQEFVPQGQMFNQTSGTLVEPGLLNIT
jgi:hypothetical protein